MKKVLVIDDDSDILELLEIILKNEGYEVFTAGSAEDGLKSFELNSPDLIFTDIELPGISGLNFLEQIKKENPDIPVIVITGTGTMHTAIDAAQFDAFEYVEKPLEVDIVQDSARRALAAGGVKYDDDLISAELLENSEHDDIVGKSEAIQAVFRRIGELIRTPLSSPILITGEVGTGKSLIAKTIHSKNSDSSNSPFLSISCSALSDAELNTLLFGSGAEKGHLELVKTGTLYFKDVFDMSRLFRAKLLSVIDDRQFRSTDSSNSLEFRGRIISSVTTTQNTDFTSSEYAEDELFYRLSTHEINVPPLRERKADLPLLALQEMLRSSDRLEKEFDGISNKFIEKLGEYDFPGNLSELKNIIGESVIRSRSKVLGVSDLSDIFSSKSQYNKKSGTPEIQKEKIAEIGLNARGLVAIFFADMVGYTSLMQENESGARELIEIMRSKMKPIIENYDGKNLTYVGDETLCTFSSAIMAVTAAIEMQKTLKEKNLFKIRIGIHIGDVVVKENEIYGDGVNVASRIEPLAAPGEICISQDVYNNIHNQVDIITESMGVKNLKNVQSDMHVYKVVIE